MKHLEQTLVIYVYSHYNICNILIYFATSTWNTCNMHMKSLEHLKYVLATCQAWDSSGRRPPCLASLEAVAKYSTATTSLPSLAAGGGDEGDFSASAGGEAGDVCGEGPCSGTRSGSHLRIWVTPRSWESLESSHVVANIVVTTMRGERSRTKAVATTRAMVRRSRRQGRMRDGVRESS
jgi:hypothetical protein